MMCHRQQSSHATMRTIPVRAVVAYPIYGQAGWFVPRPYSFLPSTIDLGELACLIIRNSRVVNVFVQPTPSVLVFCCHGRDYSNTASQHPLDHRIRWRGIPRLAEAGEWD